jgi:hypothetical protein
MLVREVYQLGPAVSEECYFCVLGTPEAKLLENLDFLAFLLLICWKQVFPAFDSQYSI